MAPAEPGRNKTPPPFLLFGWEPGVVGRDFDLLESPNELIRGLESVNPKKFIFLPLRDESGEVCSRMTTSVRISIGPVVCPPDEWIPSAFCDLLGFVVGDRGLDGDRVTGLEAEEDAAAA